MKTIIVCALSVLCLAETSSADGSGLPRVVIPDCLGVNIHLRGSQDEQARMIADAGFRFIRMDCTWSLIEKEKGVYDFSLYDPLLDSLERHGIRALLILDYANSLYEDGLPPHSVEARQAFAAFAAACARRYRGRGVLWEIWNEPNLYIFWKPQSSVEDYVKLAKETSAAIRKADAKATVLGPALSMYDYPFLENAFRLGFLDCVDAVSVHAYTTPKPEDVSAYYGTVRELISKYAPKGRQIPVVSGEWGYPSTAGMTVEMQAEFAVRSFLANLMNGIPLSIWYDWRNDGLNPDDKEHNYGVVYNDLKPKPARHAVAALSRTLGGYEYVCRLHTEKETDYLALFRRRDSYRLAAWTTGTPHIVRLPIDVARLEVVSLSGDSSEIAVNSSELEIELTGAVKYLVPAASTRRWATEAKWRGRAKASVESTGVRIEASAILDRSALSLHAAVPGRVTSKIGWLQGNGKTNEVTDSIPFAYDGSAAQTAVLSVKADGDERPFVRRVPVDTSGLPIVTVVPPVDSNLMFEVAKPASLRGKPFHGRISVDSLLEIAAVDGWADFVIPSDAESALVKVRTTQQPAGEFSFGFELTQNSGAALVNCTARKYRVVESFAECRPDAVPERFQIIPEGKQEAPCSATVGLEPIGLLDSTSLCLRLDYDVGIGTRNFRLALVPPAQLGIRTKRLRMWVKADGGDGLARVRFLGSDGQVFQKNLCRLDSDGWKCVSVELDAEHAWHWAGEFDGQVNRPVSLETLLTFENLGGRSGRRSVSLGPIMACD